MNFHNFRPTDRGRDPHTAAHRLFRELQLHAADMYQRLVHNASAIHGLKGALARMRKIVAAHPLVLDAAHVRALENEIQGASHYLEIAGVSSQGVSAKTSMVRHLVDHGLDLGRTLPQPSLN